MNAATLEESPQREAALSYDKVVCTSAVRDVVRLLRATAAPETPDSWKGQGRSLMDLQGLGRDIWQGVDAMAYIGELRDEWDDR